MTDDEIYQLIVRRNEALKAGAGIEAQYIKREILTQGFVLEDKLEGTTWYRDNA